MATALTDSLSFEDVTICSICFEKFKTPRYLPCSHSFCHDCLSSHIISVCKSTEPRLGFNCPLCREYIPIMGSFDKPEEWAGTFPVNEILEKILKSPDPKCCDSCLRDNEEEDASDFCLSCLEFLCKMCTKYHKKHLLSRSHNTCPLNKIKSQHIQLAFGKDDVCKKHQDQKLKLFCYKHEQTCCIICGGTEHRKCDSVETVEKAAQNYKESGEIDSILADVKSFRQKLIDAKDKQERNITELEDTFDKMSDETEKEINDIVRLIERLKREQLDEFSAAIKEGKEKLIRNVITFNDGIQCAEFCSNKLEKSIEIKDESIFMTKFNAAKETFQHLKNIRFRTTGVRVTAIKKSIVKEIAQMKKLASIEVTELVQDIPSVIFDVKNVQLELITEFSSSERKVRTGTWLSNKTFIFSDKNKNIVCYGELCQKEWKYNGTIGLPQYPFGILQKERNCL